jgi:hypothetical protein
LAVNSSPRLRGDAAADAPAVGLAAPGLRRRRLPVAPVSRVVATRVGAIAPMYDVEDEEDLHEPDRGLVHPARQRSASVRVCVGEGGAGAQGWG